MTIRVLEVTRRGVVSPSGCIFAIRYIEDGEPGITTEWLDEFLERECEDVLWCVE
jgi:hypothetical protein